MAISSIFHIGDKWRYRLANIFLLAFLLTFSGFFLHERFSGLSATDKMRLDMYKSTLNSTIEQYTILPYMLSTDSTIRSALTDENGAQKYAINEKIERLNRNLKTATLFILDTQGKAIASSNWNDAGSYVGQNYSYRPYFKQAMAGQNGTFYGIGSTTNTPGFFLSTGIKENNKIIGVIVVKISLNEIEKAWSEGPENIIVTDEHGIIFLSSNAQWRMKSLQPLPVDTMKKLQSTRQYRINNLKPADYHPCFKVDRFIFLINNANHSCIMPEFYSQSVAIPEFNWEMMIIMPLENFYWTLAVTLIIVIAIYLLVLIFIKYWRMRLKNQKLLAQTNETLEKQVGERTQELESINEKLIREMKERSQAEQILQLTRSELAESSKLAALGQMATEIAHEQNQPLAALHALTDNARIMLAKEMYPQVDQNLQYTISVIERMTQLISELKTFASRHRVPKGSADVIKVMYRAIKLLNHSMEKNHVERRIKACSTPLFVGCDELGLEQIFSNLISNALDAMQNARNKRLDITICRVDQQIVVTLKDTGPGFPQDVIERIFEPFFTTKRRGMGLGLAIVSEIVRNSSGTIRADNHPEGGAIVTLTWKAWPEDKDENEQ